MSSKSKSSKPKPKKKGGSTTFSLSGQRLLDVDALMQKMSKKAGAEIKRQSVVNRVVEEGVKVVQKQV